MGVTQATVVSTSLLDPESRRWVEQLSQPPDRREAAVTALHAYLLRVARFELHRRSRAHGNSVSELDDLAVQSADDALMAILRKLDSYRGDSRFTTWAAKFAILEASVKSRRRAWQRTEITLDPDAWERFATAVGPDAVEQDALLHDIGEGIRTRLTPHQREILVAVALDGVPIDVLAERLHSNRGAIYKTLHDARRNLRAYLSERGDR
ncbi:MAG TPA: RNA polymerase sigma factor [Acetobacteraceae bacterium]|nr:RNA polymerase sigma factor [Acetobacteraceae bacterium]